MKRRRIIRKRRINAKCPFCESKTEVSYKDAEVLGRFITERGKIIGRSIMGTCSAHHRPLTIALKRARYLALLPYIVRPR